MQGFLESYSRELINDVFFANKRIFFGNTNRVLVGGNFPQLKQVYFPWDVVQFFF